MVRLSDLHPTEAEHLRHRITQMPTFEPGEWRTSPPLEEATVAIVSTAGLHRREDVPFRPGSVDYRLLPSDVDWADVAMTHISANFDRSAFQQDPNVVFPLDRLRELADAGTIGGVSRWHYSFMGALPFLTMFEGAGTEVGRLLAADDVDVALLVPV